MKNRPDIGLHPGTMLIEIGFWVFCPKNGSKTPKKRPVKAQFGLVCLDYVLVVIVDQFWSG